MSSGHTALKALLYWCSLQSSQAFYSCHGFGKVVLLTETIILVKLLNVGQPMLNTALEMFIDLGLYNDFEYSSTDKPVLSRKGKEGFLMYVCVGIFKKLC